MRVHYIQHVAFEGLSSIETYLNKKGYPISSSKMYQNDKLPSLDEFDWLIVMGGPMGIYDEEHYSWLPREKTFIKSAIQAKKTVMGICLGGQLIADALGANINKNKHREIGWFNISTTSHTEKTILANTIPDTTEVFHWHGDTFEIPTGAIPLAFSEACQNQGFIYNNHVIALQFHLETNFESASALIEHCRDELDSSKYVQTEADMLSDKQRFENINQLMFSILTKLETHHDKQNGEHS